MNMQKRTISSGLNSDVIVVRALGEGFTAGHTTGMVRLCRWTLGKLDLPPLKGGPRRTTLTEFQQWPVPVGGNAAPRLHEWPTNIWLAFRDDSVKKGILVDVTQDKVVVVLEEVGSPYPLAFGKDSLFYRASGGRTMRVDLKNPTKKPVFVEKSGTAQGLAFVTDDDEPVYVDDLQRLPYKISWGSYPISTVDLTVAQDPAGGVACQFASRPGHMMLWNGTNTYHPRCDSDGRAWAVCTSQPWRVAEISPEDI